MTSQFNSFLRGVDLSESMKERVAHLYPAISRNLQEQREIGNSGRDPYLPIDYLQNLNIIINFFANHEVDRNNFFRVFREWKREREDNIKKLQEVAGAIKDVKTGCNVAKVATGSIAAIGGAAIIGSLLFPPAATLLLPAWLGGATAGAALASILPSVLLPAAAATSPLAIGGAVAAATGAIGQVGAVITESVLLSDKIKEAKEILEKDQNNFKLVEEWFAHTRELTESMNYFFGPNSMDIFNLLDKFIKIEISFSDFMKQIGKFCCFHDSSFQLREYQILAVVITVLIVICEKYVCLVIKRIVTVASKIGRALVNAADATTNLTRIGASLGLESKIGELIPRATAGKVLVGALAGVGLTFDLAQVVLSSIELGKGSPSDEQNNVLTVVEKFKDELKEIKDIYIKLKFDMIFEDH